MEPKVYQGIVKQFKKQRRYLIKDILNTKDCCEETPLHIASRNGNYILVSRYLKLGARPSKNINGESPLELAKDRFTRKALTNLNIESSNCNEENINELVGNGEDVNDRISIFGTTPLQEAVGTKKPGNIPIIKTLLDYNADVNLEDYNGWTPLHHAAKKGDLETCVELIQNGAYVNAYSTSMKTPLHLAAFYNHPEIVNLLIAAGANIEGISNEEFLSTPIQKHSILSENVSPLLQAAKRGNIECFEVLLNQGAFFYATDIRKWNCLHYATYHNHMKMISLILKLDWQMDQLRIAKNSHGQIPQHL